MYNGLEFIRIINWLCACSLILIAKLILNMIHSSVFRFDNRVQLAFIYNCIIYIDKWTQKTAFQTIFMHVLFEN